MSEYRLEEFLPADRGNLIIISGPSGVGKGSINRALTEKNAEIHLSVSYTTRPQRNTEAEGRDYFFVDEETFNRMIEEELFLEHAEVFGVGKYGTPRHIMEQKLRDGYDVVLEIDVQGARQVRQFSPGAVAIFILPPSMEELEQRLRQRGTNSEESIRRRLAVAWEELQECNQYDYVVVNDTLDESIDRVRAIILAERCRIRK